MYLTLLLIVSAIGAPEQTDTIDIIWRGKPLTETQITTINQRLEAVQAPTAILVDLSEQRLYYKQNGQLVFMSITSTGKGRRTKPGQYKVVFKARNRGTDFPGVTMPYCLGITVPGRKPRYRIHDLKGKKYLHLLGRRASLGCIRQHPGDAKWLYQNVSIGTPVYIES